MKENELRIGNLLLVDGKETTVKGWMIHLIQIGKNGNKVIEPIPITEELLIRFGFKPFGEKGFLSLEAFSPGHPSQRFDIDWNIEKGVMCKSRYQGDSDWFFMRHIQQVHQLQNLYFALTGEELKLTDQ